MGEQFVSEDGTSITEVLAALSRALDMVEGQPPGHAVRTSLICHRLGSILKLDEVQQSELFFAALLKDTGCSNNSARIYHIFGGDDFMKKKAVKLINWSSQLESVRFAIGNVEKDAPAIFRLKKLLAMVREGGTAVMHEVTAARCTRGATISKSLGFSDNVAGAIQSLDEHWDGKGSPYGLRGTDIPLQARILCLAQTLEIFVSALGLSESKKMVKSRRGKWFDPDIADAGLVLLEESPFWSEHFRRMAESDISLPEIIDVSRFSNTKLDDICTAFAQIIDAKSTFTGEHSTRVTEYSVSLGTYFGYTPAKLSTLRRAALLHDIGKLGVLNSILEKPAKLTEDEFAQVKLHPKNTYLILSQIRGFERITEIASAHHERLDGRGYWQGLSADQLDLDMRIVTASDVFDALTAARPYRDAMPLEKVFEIMDADVDKAFDADCVAALKAIYSGIEKVAA